MKKDFNSNKYNPIKFKNEFKVDRNFGWNVLNFRCSNLKKDKNIGLKLINLLKNITMWKETENNINRSMDDIDDKILTAAEVKAVATNNPILQEKMSIDNEVARLQMIRMRWSNDRSRLMNELDSFPVKIEKLKRALRL